MTLAVNWEKNETKVAASAQLTIPRSISRYHRTGAPSPICTCQSPLMALQQITMNNATADDTNRLNFIPERTTAMSPLTAKGQNVAARTSAMRHKNVLYTDDIMWFISLQNVLRPAAACGGLSSTWGLIAVGLCRLVRLFYLPNRLARARLLPVRNHTPPAQCSNSYR